MTRARSHAPQLLTPSLRLPAETPLEALIMQQREWQIGIHWGTPRPGHPEGSVFNHILEVLKNVELLDVDAKTREQLRLITLTHDTLKYMQPPLLDATRSKHHSILAHDFTARFVDDPCILKTIRLHDEAYFSWRLIYRRDQLKAGEAKLARLLDELGECLQLYYLFFWCDTCTGDKTLEPVDWFETMVPDIAPLVLKTKAHDQS